MALALYRRYRPETFADVIGQEHVTGPLTQALRTGRVSHAYLFSGPRGCGKTTSARILARCLNCESGPTAQPCGSCDSCTGLARGGPGTVDVIEIDAASHGGVDDARDLRERAAFGPATSRYKVYVIDEAHMVTPQGFNALLKVVEEPPEHVKFVFATTEPDRVIATIRSRTHHYPFRLVPPLRLQDYLAGICAQEGVAVAPGVLSFVVRSGGGSVRDSLSVLDQLIAGSGEGGLTYEGAAALLGFTEVELLDAVTEGLAAGDAAAVFRQVDKVIESGHDPRRFVEDLLERLRDLIVVTALPDGGASVLRGIPADQMERMRSQAAAFGPGALSRAADIVNTGLTEMTGATAPRLQLELMCARVLLPGASGESGYAARLDRLERRLDVSSPGPSAGFPGPGAAAVPRRDGAAARQAPDTGAVHGSGSQRGPGSGPIPVSSGLGGAAAGGPGPADPVSGGAGGGRAAGGGPGSGGADPGGAGGAGTGPGGAGDGGGGGAARRDGEAGRVGAGRSVQRAGGAVDTEAMRRSWPDVLTRIAGMRRATWTFLSEHARVLDYDGERLLLGIATVGLATTFRGGPHAEVVRQALIEALGVDTRVEATVDPPPAAAGSGAASGQRAEPAAQGSRNPSGGGATGGPDSGDGASGGAASGDGASAGGARTGSVRPAGRRPGSDTAGRTGGSSPSRVAAATAPVPAESAGVASAVSGPTRAGPGAGGIGDAAGGVRPVVDDAARHGHQAGSDRSGSARDAAGADAAASPDDEELDGAGESGEEVVKRLLGATVLRRDDG